MKSKRILLINKVLIAWMILFAASSFFFCCKHKFMADQQEPQYPKSHQEMVDILKNTYQKMWTSDNGYCVEAKLAYVDSLIKIGLYLGPKELLTAKFNRARFLLEYGDEAAAVEQYKELFRYYDTLSVDAKYYLFLYTALAHMRLGERTNCLNHHSADACIMPIKNGGIHQDPYGSRQTIEFCKVILSKYPNDYDVRWLLNIAYMTLGEYPAGVPPQWLVPGLDAESEFKIAPLEDIASDTRLGVDNRAGGVIVEDFDNDGYLDIVTSAWGLDDPMFFFKNNGDGTFTDLSRQSGLGVLTGGLNMVSTDYNNDGYVDIFVLRGAWQGHKGFGEQPNSLIKNNGDGTFTDVTTTAGLLSYRPTQTATWNDFNRDGWLDLFVGNETIDPAQPYPCEFYINNQDGTFTNVAKETGAEISRFVKGVTSGDYNNDGWPDIFISTQDSTTKVLLLNKGIQGKVPAFEDVTQKAGIDLVAKTFATWFWDFDNDGWLDLFMSDYDFDRPLSYYAAAHALKQLNNNAGKMYLYRNNRNGTFTEVAQQINLHTIAFAMGANFGDIDNDGWLDFYLGTGNPHYLSLVPNKFFKNIGGKKFADITTASRTGNLQKGHGVAFADLDNDGDQDIFINMGGAFRGDHYPNSFYLNPRQNDNKWICIKLEGTASNKMAIGARMELKFRENGLQRSVFREVNSGGSFGCSPLRAEIGVGNTELIEEINIRWPATGQVQTLKNITPNRFIKITEGKENYVNEKLRTLDFKNKVSRIPMCKPDGSITYTQ